MLVLIGVAAGPLSMVGLNQNAVNQTFAPAGVSAGKTMSNTALVVFPSNVQSASVAGGVAPTWLKTAAPFTPGGLGRPASAASCRRSRTVLPSTETTSTSGAADGGGIGVGS